MFNVTYNDGLDQEIRVEQDGDRVTVSRIPRPTYRRKHFDKLEDIFVPGPYEATAMTQQSNFVSQPSNEW